MAGKPGFFAALFDFSFTDLVTTRLASAVYALAVGAAGLLALVVTVYGLGQSPGLGILFAIVAGVGFLLCVVLVRLWLEAVVVLSRIAEHAEEIAEQVAGIAVDTATGSRSERSAHVGSSNV